MVFGKGAEKVIKSTQVSEGHNEAILNQAGVLPKNVVRLLEMRT